MDLCRGNIRVFCRARPVLEVERRSGQDAIVASYPYDDVINIQQVRVLYISVACGV